MTRKISQRIVERMLQRSHKGGWCWLAKKRFCQEKYCLACKLFLDWEKSDEKDNGQTSL